MMPNLSVPEVLSPLEKMKQAEDDQTRLSIFSWWDQEDWMRDLQEIRRIWQANEYYYLEDLEERKECGLDLSMEDCNVSCGNNWRIERCWVSGWINLTRHGPQKCLAYGGKDWWSTVCDGWNHCWLLEKIQWGLNLAPWWAREAKWENYWIGIARDSGPPLLV